MVAQRVDLTVQFPQRRISSSNKGQHPGHPDRSHSVNVDFYMSNHSNQIDVALRYRQGAKGALYYNHLPMPEYVYHHVIAG